MQIKIKFNISIDAKVYFSKKDQFYNVIIVLKAFPF